MARPLRIRGAGGWYHVMGRGRDRGRLFRDDADRAHFLGLLETMREVYRVRVFAYALMETHYHLLLGTPEANLSRAMHWVHTAYGMWHARRHGLLGAVFGGRFKAVVIEDGAWGLEASAYVHLNPIATEGMGLGKRVRSAQRQGVAAAPTAEEVRDRLGTLRSYRWSSYRAYAGLTGEPAWLDAGALLGRLGKEAEGQRAAYRRLIEERVRQGTEESLGAKVRWGAVLGGERFVRRVRGKVRPVRETASRGEWRQRRTFEDLVRMVERIKRERWDEFRDRYGDWGRDLVLWAGRQYGGLTLRELGERVGGADYTAVAMAVQRLRSRCRRDRRLRRAMQTVAKQCEK